VADNRGPVAAVDASQAEHTQHCCRAVAGVRRSYFGGAT
jgi:hypothetical protein